MQKSIGEMALFLRNLLPSEISETYAVDSMFFSISDEGRIRKGIPAFRDFLFGLYSRLIDEGSSYDKPKKAAHAFTDNTSIAACYPFLSNIAVILINIGLQGVLSEDALLLESLQSGSAENVKIPDSKKAKCLRFLTDCGLHFSGIDFNDKKPDLSIPVIITYPENPDMLIGLKIMAAAQRDLGSTSIQHILLRCDYKALSNSEVDTFLTLKDLINPLPADVKEFVLKLHKSYVGQGHKCVFSTTNFYIRLTYFCRSKELWRFNISLNNGYNIGIKATNTHKYPETVAKFPVWLQEKISKGYGCGKKRGLSVSCDGGCRGYRVPLDDSFMEISDIIEAWIYKEVSCIQEK